MIIQCKGVKILNFNRINAVKWLEASSAQKGYFRLCWTWAKSTFGPTAIELRPATGPCRTRSTKYLSWSQTMRCVAIEVCRRRMRWSSPRNKDDASVPKTGAGVERHWVVRRILPRIRGDGSISPSCSGGDTLFRWVDLWRKSTVSEVMRRIYSRTQVDALVSLHAHRRSVEIHVTSIWDTSSEPGTGYRLWYAWFSSNRRQANKSLEVTWNEGRVPLSFSREQEAAGQQTEKHAFQISIPLEYFK